MGHAGAIISGGKGTAAEKIECFQEKTSRNGIVDRANAELGRAAVEAVASRLVQQHGDAVRDHRVKRMIGHMVKQILHDLGYGPLTANVRVRVGGLFKRGTRYERYPQ